MVSKRLTTICLLMAGAALVLPWSGCKQRGGGRTSSDTVVLSEKSATGETASGAPEQRVAQEPAKSGPEGEPAKPKVSGAEGKAQPPEGARPDPETGKPAAKPAPKAGKEATAGTGAEPKPQPATKAEAKPQQPSAAGTETPTGQDQAGETQEKKPETARETGPGESEAPVQRAAPTPERLQRDLQTARSEAATATRRARRAADRGFWLALLALAAALWALIPALLRKRREEQPTDSAAAVLEGLFEAWLWRPLALMGRVEQRRLADTWKQSGAESPALPANVSRSEGALKAFSQRLEQWSANVHEAQTEAGERDPDFAASLTGVRRLAEQCRVSYTDQEAAQNAIRRNCQDPDVSRITNAVGRVRRDMGDYESWLMQRVEGLSPSEAGALLGPNGFGEYVAEVREEVLDRWSKTAAHVEEACQVGLRQAAVGKTLQQWAGHLLELRTRAEAMQRQLDEANPATAEGLTTVRRLRVIVSGVTDTLYRALTEAGMVEYWPPENVRPGDLPAPWQQRSVEVLPTQVPMRADQHQVGAVAEVAEPAWVLNMGHSEEPVTIRTAKVKLFGAVQPAAGPRPVAPAPAPAPAGPLLEQAEAPPAARPAAPAPVEVSPGEPPAGPGPAPPAAEPPPADPAGAPPTGLPAAEAPSAPVATQPAQGVGAEMDDEGTGSAAEEQRSRDEGAGW